MTTNAPRYYKPMPEYDKGERPVTPPPSSPPKGPTGFFAFECSTKIPKEINTHGMVVDFGRHSGTPYTRVPVSYLKWMVQSNHSRKDVAVAELKRRGTVTPDLDISGHAIDSASLRLRKKWHETALDENEGLHAWLVRMCKEAIDKNEMPEDGVIFHDGMKFCFEKGEWPVLKTIMPR